MSHWTDTATDKELVGEMLSYDDGLSSWEADRADEWSKDYVDKGRPLSEKQRAICRKVIIKMEAR